MRAASTARASAARRSIRGQFRSYWFSFGKPDKRRPVVVLTRTGLIEVMGRISVASCTTTQRGAPSEVQLGVEDGLSRECAVNLHEVYTVEKRELGPYITQLVDRVMARVDAALVLTLGIGERVGDA